jgi:type IV pilus assembly protein PilM
MIVAARSELIDAISRALINVGCEPEVVDVAPVAIYNATRFNYADADGCTLVIDIGARCTNLVFVEAGRIFYRTIPVAGNTITSEIAKTFECDLETAEQVKCERGLVAQGGAFAVDDPEIDRLSKVIRNVMARLNAEVMRSISFYRSQQEGEAPSRILLTGATSQLPYLQNFFEEKMQVPVDFLNPFQTIEYPKKVDEEAFGRDAFSLSVLVGLALRRGLTCPAEINLVSKELVERKIFRKRIPFFVIAGVGLIAMELLWFFHFNKIASYYTEELNSESENATELNNVILAQEAHNGRVSDFEGVEKKYKDAQKCLAAYNDLLTLRGKSQNYLNVVEQALPEGAWLTSFKFTRPQNSKEPPTGVEFKVAVFAEEDSTTDSVGSKIVTALTPETGLYNPKIGNIDANKAWVRVYTITADFAPEKNKKGKNKGKK